MKDLTIRWTLPTVRESGQPLALAEIGGTEVAISADGGLNFTVLTRLPNTDTEHLVPELEEGYWVFRLVCFDVDNRESLPVEEGWDGSPPGIISEVIITAS